MKAGFGCDGPVEVAKRVVKQFVGRADDIGSGVKVADMAEALALCVWLSIGWTKFEMDLGTLSRSHTGVRWKDTSPGRPVRDIYS